MMITKQSSLTIKSILQIRSHGVRRPISSSTSSRTSSTVLIHKDDDDDDDGKGFSNQRQGHTRNHYSTMTIPATRKIYSISSIISSSSSSSHSSSIATKQDIRVLPKPRRSFHTESEYHNVADQTLHTIQDTLDFYFEDNPSFYSPSSGHVPPDITYASGVLTIALSQGTWVLNKQTPNRQIWWSSPISGPRRYEYDEECQKWIWSRLVDADTSKNNDENNRSICDTSQDIKYLGEALKKEMVDLFHLDKGLEDLDSL
mmetsp:Transcript_12541/g.23536  ORF Transcript_12541/g.23536 Transcript_12541/m.23536 type:complete len:258 (+) Transcript_12541:61-834(+)